MRPVGRHAVLAGDGAQRQHVLVGAGVPHHPDRPDGEEHREGLPHLVVPAALPEDPDEEGVRLAEDAQALLRHLPQHPNGQARPREGVAPEDLPRQAQLLPGGAHLVLEELPQGLDEGQLHPLGEPAHVVVALDGGRGALEGDALDHVRVEGALGQELDLPELPRLPLEDADEGLADALALGLGVGHPGQGAQELSPRVHGDEVHLEPPAEGLDDLLPLVLPQEAVVHEDAGELAPHRAVDEGGGDRGVHPAREAADDLFLPHLGADAAGRLVDEGAHGPVPRAAADAEDEVAEDLLAPRGVDHLGVELDAVEPVVGRDHRGHGRAVRVGERPEAGRGRLDRVPVAHPDGLAPGRAREDAHRRVHHQLGPAVLAAVHRGHPPPEEVGHELHPVADAENRDILAQKLGVDGGGTVFVNARWAPRQDHSPGLRRQELAPGSGAGVDLAVRPELAHAPRDQLGVLGAEVEDEDPFAHDAQRVKNSSK